MWHYSALVTTFSAGGITHSIQHSSGVGGVTVACVGWGAMVASAREGCALHGEEEQHSA